MTYFGHSQNKNRFVRELGPTSIFLLKHSPNFLLEPPFWRIGTDLSPDKRRLKQAVVTFLRHVILTVQQGGSNCPTAFGHLGNKNPFAGN